jgi:hypothetical protein
MHRFNFLLVLLIASPALYSQVNNNAFSFKGKWINTQYEDYSDRGADKRVLYNITPQYIIVDSIQKCTLVIRYEQKAEFGKPVKKTIYGNIQKLEYKTNYVMHLTQIAENPNIILMSFYNNPSGIIFRREN